MIEPENGPGCLSGGTLDSLAEMADIMAESAGGAATGGENGNESKKSGAEKDYGGFSED